MDDRASFCAISGKNDKSQASHWSLTLNGAIQGTHFTSTRVIGGGPTPQEHPDPENDEIVQDGQFGVIDDADSESDDESDNGSTDEEIDADEVAEARPLKTSKRGEPGFEINLFFPEAGAQKIKKPVAIDWFQGQLERAPTTQQLHIHVHLKTDRAISFNMLKGLLDKTPWQGVHIEKVKTIKAHMDYVIKEDTRVAGPYFTSKCPAPGDSVQGKRTDWDGFKADAIQVASNPALWKKLWEDRFDLMIRYYKGCEKYVAVNMKTIRRPDHEIIVLYGEPGTGKSTLAAKFLTDLFEGQEPYFKGAGKWWESYSGQLGVVMDDFDCSGQNIQALKNVLDKTPCTIENKGGSFPLMTVCTVITTNTHPLRWGTAVGEKAISDVDRIAILRRCHFFEMNMLEGRGFAPRGRLNDRGHAVVASIHAAMRLVKDETHERTPQMALAECRAMRDVTSAMEHRHDNNGNMAPFHVAQPFTPVNPARPTAFMPAVLRPQARLVDALRDMREQVADGARSAPPALVIAPQNAERPAIPIIIDDNDDDEIQWLTAQLARNRRRNRDLPVWGPNGFEAPVAGSPVPEEGSARDPIEL